MRRALDHRELNALELLDSHRRQLERLQPVLNAYTRVFEEPLGLPGAFGPLEGIPMSIKDSLDIAGEATVCGHLPRVGHRAPKNSICVSRLMEAGAVVIGKTNTPEMLMNWETHNNAYGVSRNPWDPARTPGGSSGGESAAISACMSAGGIGSDGGGSIRLPAAMTGICGLKPTPGRVPATGHFPRVGYPGGLLGVIGPMARSVEDLGILFHVVAGHDDSDPFSVPFLPSELPVVARVGIVDHHVVQMALPFVDAAFDEFPEQAWQHIYEVWRFFFLKVNAHPIGFPTPHTAEFLAVEAPTGQEMLEMFAARETLRAKFLRALDEFPILLMPNPGFGAWRLGEFPGVPSMTTMCAANLFGLPSLAIPVGFDAEGLPLSIQALAKPWQEELLLDFGMRLEKARGRFPLPTMARSK